MHVVNGLSPWRPCNDIGFRRQFNKEKVLLHNKGIYGNIFKLRISEFQALATPAVYKSCHNHRRSPGSWKISTGLKRRIFQDMRRGYPFPLTKPALSDRLHKKYHFGI